MTDVFRFLTVEMVSQVCTQVNTDQTVHVKYAQRLVNDTPIKALSVVLILHPFYK